MTKEVMKQEQDDSVIYIQKMIEALYENSDPVSVEAAELLERINFKQGHGELVYDLLDDARAVLEVIVHDQPDDTFRDARDLIPKLRKQLGLPTIINFTTPQQRKPLTDEQIEEIADGYLVDYRIPAGCAWNFARDIEAAHGIKE